MSEEYDNELLTDLTVVFFGLGIFLANTPRNWDSQYKKWPSTNLNKPEYMTPPMFGYALAHLAWFRGEEKPIWAKHLHWKLRGQTSGRQCGFCSRQANSTFKPKRWRSLMLESNKETYLKYYELAQLYDLSYVPFLSIFYLYLSHVGGEEKGHGSLLCSG